MKIYNTVCTLKKALLTLMIATATSVFAEEGALNLSLWQCQLKNGLNIRIDIQEGIPYYTAYRQDIANPDIVLPVKGDVTKVKYTELGPSFVGEKQWHPSAYFFRFLNGKYTYDVYHGVYFKENHHDLAKRISSVFIYKNNEIVSRIDCKKNFDNKIYQHFALGLNEQILSVEDYTLYYEDKDVDFDKIYKENQPETQME